MASQRDIRDHWRGSQRLTLVLMLIWFVVSFLIPFYARELSAINLFGWPLPFYMAAQGAPLVYVVIIGVYAVRMQALDREYRLDQDAQR